MARVWNPAGIDEEVPEEEHIAPEFGWFQITTFMLIFALAGYAIGRKIDK